MSTLYGCIEQVNYLYTGPAPPAAEGTIPCYSKCKRCRKCLRKLDLNMATLNRTLWESLYVDVFDEQNVTPQDDSSDDDDDSSRRRRGKEKTSQGQRDRPLRNLHFPHFITPPPPSSPQSHIYTKKCGKNWSHLLSCFLIEQSSYDCVDRRGGVPQQHDPRTSQETDDS